MCKNEYWTDMEIPPPPPPPLCRQNHAEKVMKVQITANHMRGDSLLKVDMQRVQNLGQTKCLTENLMPMQKGALRPNDWASFHEI